MLSFEGTGKNIEKAIQNALFELKAPREDVDIKILDEGGLFKKARVEVSISEDVRARYEARENKLKVMTDEECESYMTAAINKVSEEEKSEIEPETEQEVQADGIEQTDEKSELINEADKKDSETESEAYKKTNEVFEEENGGLAFIEGLLDVLAIDATVSQEEENGTLKLNVSGGSSGNLVGYRGECLNAIQYLASIIEGKNSTRSKRIVLDIDSYRAKREQTLISLAGRMAKKVAKTGHQVRLEPMTANERRIIHTALSDCADVTTVSKGTEPGRYLIIMPKETENV